MDLTEIGIYLGYLIIIWLVVDFIILIINGAVNKGLDCAKEGWIPAGPMNWILKGDDCVTASTSKGMCGDLGRWKIYKKDTVDGDSTNSDSLCRGEIDSLYKDLVENNIIGGYNPMELIAYVIVPFVTILCIIWGLISTRLNKAEWTFWILIATIIFTSLTSLSYDSDISILPDQPSPLTYITDKLNFGAADELKYSFVSRKQNGDECFVEGTILGGGVHPENQPPSYSGTCNEKSLPLY
jgi:hypothetical protein